jgi:hypothetical protein
MKYKPGYIIFMSISVVLFCGTMLGIYQITHKIWMFSTLERAEGKIIYCKSKYFKRKASSGGGGQKLKYAPVAKTNDGVEVAGSVYSSNDSCKKLIHGKVSMLIDSNTESGGYILTFSQFWLGSIALIFGTLIANLVFVYPIARAAKKI